jgi:hypothetical protein
VRLRWKRAAGRRDRGISARRRHCGLRLNGADVNKAEDEDTDDQAGGEVFECVFHSLTAWVDALSNAMHYTCHVASAGVLFNQKHLRE